MSLSAAPARHCYAAVSRTLRSGRKGRSASVEIPLAALDVLQLLKRTARISLRGAHRLVLGADLLLLDADLLLLHADLLGLETPSLAVVPGATVLVPAAVAAILDALDRLPDAMLTAPALGRGARRRTENETESDCEG